MHFCVRERNREVGSGKRKRLCIKERERLNEKEERQR